MMDKLYFLKKKNNGFTFVEIVVVLFIISIVIAIISINPIASYEKYKEKLAVNEVVSDIYLVQSKSLSGTGGNYIYFYERSNEYVVYYDYKARIKNIGQNGISGVGERALQFLYNKGNVNIANTVTLRFKYATYKIIIHLETGYVSVEEIKRQ